MQFMIHECSIGKSVTYCTIIKRQLLVQSKTFAFLNIRSVFTNTVFFRLKVAKINIEWIHFDTEGPPDYAAHYKVFLSLFCEAPCDSSGNALTEPDKSF